ncbi:MAG: VanW family protein [Clostridia bacterium]|nr:VanW family protein [Clostridia bacterium]
MKKILMLIFILLALNLGCRGGEVAQEAPVDIDMQPYLTLTEYSKQPLSFSIDEASFTVEPADIGLCYTSGGQRLCDGQVLMDYCNALEVLYTEESEDASISATDSFENPFVVTLSKDGRSLSAKEVFECVINSGTDEVVIGAQRIAPDVTTDSLQQQNSLISTYTTSFDSSTLRKENRVFNITKAAELIDGVVVEPDEVFSINETIGDRNKKNGWKTAGAISGGKYVQEYGGGVCQVSSTLFNAVMMADLKIVERHHHSWPMSYVPIGRDATISTGTKDFRFQNTTEYPVTIRTYVDQSAYSLTICIYGLRSSDYAYIEIESEKTGNVDSLPDEVHLDESLPANTKVVEREGRRGKKSTTYKLYYSESGELLDRVVSHKDTYPSIAAIVYLSPDLYY